jgi:hypothetical protein
MGTHERTGQPQNNVAPGLCLGLWTVAHSLMPEGIDELRS